MAEVAQGKLLVQIAYQKISLFFTPNTWYKHDDGTLIKLLLLRSFVSKRTKADFRET